MAARKTRWHHAFLQALEDTHLVTSAAQKAGISRATAYRERERDNTFREAWDEIEERSTEILEQIAVKRAAEGSDTLLIFLLKARRPDTYREYREVRHTGHDGGPVGLQLALDDKQRKALADVLRSRPAKRN